MTNNEEWISSDESELIKIRKKFTRRSLMFLVLSFFIIILVVAYLFLRSLSSLTSGMCGNEIITRSQQPDIAKNDLVYFRRDCGATTGYSFHLSIIKHGKELKNEAGNIYISNGEFTTEWIDKNSIIVKGSNKGHFKKNNKYMGIQIKYE